MGTVADGRLDVQTLITHTAPLDEATSLFALLDTQTDEVMQVVIQFGSTCSILRRASELAQAHAHQLL